MESILQREHETHRNGSHNGWQNKVTGALWAVILLLAGWTWSDAQSTRDELRRQTQANAERIATLEESVRGLNRSLDRIEAGVNELRRERRIR